MKNVAFTQVLAVLFVTSSGMLACLGSEVKIESLSPGKDYLAQVRSRWAIDPPKQSLWLADANGKHAVKLHDLGEDTEWCNEIVWNNQGREVAFLINNQRLVLFDAESKRNVGELLLLDKELAQRGGEVRNIRFASEGAQPRVFEFEICPHGRQNGCQPGGSASFYG